MSEQERKARARTAIGLAGQTVESPQHNDGEPLGQAIDRLRDGVFGHGSIQECYETDEELVAQGSRADALAEAIRPLRDRLAKYHQNCGPDCRWVIHLQQIDAALSTPEKGKG